MRRSAGRIGVRDSLSNPTETMPNDHESRRLAVVSEVSVSRPDTSGSAWIGCAVGKIGHAFYSAHEGARSRQEAKVVGGLKAFATRVASKKR
jgi:hypothetical protein